MVIWLPEREELRGMGVAAAGLAHGLAGTRGEAHILQVMPWDPM